MWHFINIYTWIFHGEERMAMKFDEWGMPIEQQIFWILLTNVCVISIEVGFFTLVRLSPRIPWLHKVKNWRWVLRLRSLFETVKNWRWVMLLRTWLRRFKSGKPGQIVHLFTRGKPIGLFTLALMAVMPGFQKIGSAFLVTKCRHLGVRGFGALCVGGAIRVIVMVSLEEKMIWGVIAAAVTVRVVIFMVTAVPKLLRHFKGIGG